MNFAKFLRKPFLQNTSGGIHPICETFRLEELSQDAGKLLEGMHAGIFL